MPKSEYSEMSPDLCVLTTAVVTHVHLAHRYYAITETYLKAVALKRMPPNLQTVDMLKAGISLVLCILFYFLPHTLG